MNIQQFRQKYPQYAALDDEELTRRLYDRHYSDKLDPTEFRSRFLGRTPVDEQILPPAPVTAPETGAPAPVVAPEVPPSNFNGARPVQDMVADQQDQVIRPTAQGRSTAAGMLASTRQLAIAPARALNEKRQRDDEIDLARAEVMPEAVKFARANKINILDVPAVQAKAKELGMRPDAFIRGGAEYLAMTPEELAARKTGRTEAMSERSHRLSTAREMYKENQDEIAANRPTDAPIEAFFYDLGVAAPKLAGTVAAGMTTGPAGALAVMGTSVAPEFYNDGLDKGLSPEQASGYMMLMTAAELVPETFVFGKIFNKAAAAKTIKESVLATFGKRAFEAGALEAPSEMITEALQIGVEKGVFDQNTTLPEALKRIGYAGLMGFGMGVGLGAGPAAGAAGDQRKIELARRAQEAHERTLAETAAELSAVPMPQSLRKREAEHRAREAAQEVLDELTPTQLAKKKLDKLTRAATAGKVVDPKQLEEAREAYEQTVIESARDKLMSGELAPEQQQEAAQALQEIDAAPEDGAPRPVKGRVRTTEEAPAPAKPGPGGKPKATAPAALSEAETARHDALNRVAQADTIEGTDLETLIGQGLARVSPQGQPILLPAGRRQLKELTGRLDAAEAAKVTEVTEVTDKSRSVVKKTPVVAKKKQIVAKKPQAAETKNIPAPKKSATPPAAPVKPDQKKVAAPRPKRPPDEPPGPPPAGAAILKEVAPVKTDARAKIAALPAERRAKITARAEQLIEEELPKGAASMSEADQLGRDILDRPGMRDEQRRISEENRQKLLEGDALAQKPPGFEQDNPAQRGDENGRKWLAGKIKNVEEDMATAKKRGQKDGSMARGIGGSATAWVRDLDLPTDVLATIGGTNGEEKIRKPGEHQFDRLMETVRKEGFNQEKSPILVMVNHKGEAMIHEGNTRVAVAKAIGQKTVRAEVRYWNGGETVDGKLSPAKVAALAGGEEQLPKGAASVAEKVTAPDGPLLAPNGKPSKLSRTQWEQVRSPEFKNWFGDWEEFALIQGGVWNDSKKNVSKVVDRETGEPLVVYHGSPVAGFDTIRPGVRESTSIGQRVKAAFFTDNLDIAGTYSGRHANEVNLEVDEDPGPGYYPVFLNIRDPNEEHFGGANWDGSRQGQWAVFKTDDRGFYDPAEPEQVYAPDGTGYFTDRDEAFRLAMKSGGVADHAPDVGTSTNGVVAEAARYKQDGAIIRQVVDNGGRGESWEPSDVFVIFDPNQAKSATQNTGGFSKTDDRLAFALAPIFYSQLTRVAESAKLTKATGAQWYGALKNSPGVKQEELDWSSVKEWLGDRKGVTKEEVTDYLRAVEMKVEVVNREGERVKYTRTGLFTPGGGDLVELLLTLPERTNSSRTVTKYRVFEADGTEDSSNIDTEEHAKRIIARQVPGGRFESYEVTLPVGHNFASGHWVEENVVAWLRGHMREDSEGRLTFHIDENQSDWHQKGRKQGYRNRENKGWREDANVWVVYLPADGTAVDVPKNLAASGPEAVRYAAAHRNELSEFVAKEQSTGVPDAPFKTTWPELALKRAIRWAVENGADQITWTTSDMQNERYDLSKHLDSVIVELYGTRGKAGTGTWNITGYKDGEDVVAQRDIPREKVADFIGKDAADKAFAEIDANDDPNYNRAILTGLDLQVGGEGMRGFYDKILVAAADKIGKKYGSKTGTARISTSGAFTVHDRGLYAQLRWDVVDDNGLSQISTPFEDRPDAEDVAEALNLRTGVTSRQVHALRLTPELKAAALGGFPMFARGLPVDSQVTPAELRRATAYVEGAIGVRLQVRQRLSEAPQYVQDDLAAITAASRVQGYYFDGPHGPEVWLIGENLQDYDQAVEVAFHEAEHMGIRGLVGRPGTRGYNETMDRLWASFPAQGRVAAQRNKIDLTTGSDEFRLAKRRLAAEEMVAYAGGRLLQRKGTKDQRDVWQRIVDKFRDLMRQFGVGRYQKYNDADLNALIFRAIRKAGKVSAAQRKYVAEFWTAEAEGTTDYTPASVGDSALLGMPGETAIPGQGPVTIGPFAPARIAAQRYKRETGLGSYEVRTYQRVNESRARRIANAYQNMRHDPLNPKVRAAYDALAKETLAQYQAIKATGLKVEFIPKGQNPYAVSPRLAIEDVRNNNHLWVFPTDDGFGGADPDAEYLQNNPLLAETDEYVGQHRLLVNDVFRIVHDYFGHVQEGNGFRFDGEENAWRVHSAMYSPLARAAMTTETRGQNSWLNFGPFGEKNRTANQADTVYAEQKIGLLPEEFWEPDPEDGPGAAAAELESATFEDFRPENIGNILNRDRWAILTADNPGARPLPPAQNMRRWHRLRQELGIRKLRFIDAKGRYGNPVEENSFVVVGISEREAVDLGRRFGQESVLTRAGFVYMDGRPVTPATGVTVHDTAPKNFYTQIPKTGALFTVNLNFSGAGAMSVAKDEAAATVRRIAKHLSPEVRTSLNRGTAQKLVTMFDALPDEKEMGAVALAGLAKKGWYKDAAETLVNIFGPDAPRFAGLIAALSPRVHVQDNLKHAVNVWAGWVQAGRPADRKAIIDIMSKNLWNAKNRDGETVGVMPSWINNTVRALTHADPANLVLSGPKVDSFAANLRGEVNRVTLDSWMAAFANIKQSGLGGSINVAGTNPGKRPTYAAFEARVRQTAAYLTKKTGEVWTPAEVQETIWSWTKTLTEMAAEGGAMTSAREIVENGELTDELINATVDFTTLFAQPEHRQTLRDAGYGEQLDRADGAQAARAGARRQAPPPSRADRQRLLTAAGRIDQVVAGRRRTETEDVGDIAFSILGGNTGNQDLDEFLDKIGAPRRTLKQWWEDTTDNLRARIRFNLLDDLWGIGNAGNLAGVSLSDVGYKNAHLARSAAELTQALIEHGFPVWARDGTHELAEVDTSMGGLVDILKPLNGNVNLYLAWKVANRADRLMGEGRENLFTQAQIDAAKDLHLQHPEFLVVDRQFVAFQKKVLDFAEAAGIIDPAGRALWEHADYIPFYRIIESGQIKGPSAQSPLGKVRNQIRRLKGGRENLGDPLENLAKNWHSLMDASLKAHAARTVIDALDGSGLVTRAPQIEFTQAIVPLSQVKNFIKNNPLLAAHLRAAGIDPAKLPPAAFQGLQKMMAVQPPSGEDIISVWRGGKREYWHVHDELLFESLMNIPKAAWGPWMEFFRFPKRIFTATTTSTPQFGIRNFWRDMLHAFVQGAAGRNVTIVPGWDSVRGAVSQMRMDPAAVANLAGGGSFTHGYIRGGDMTGAANTVRRSLHKASPSQHVLDTPMKVVRFYRDLLNAAENTHRIAIRQRMLNAGASRLDATYESRDLLDFAKTGNSNIVRFIVQSVPFWNARLQGLDRLGRGAGGGKAVAAAIFMRGALYTMAVLALLAKYYDDERYKALADSDKANYLHFWDVIEDGDHWKMPVPFEVGTLFGTVPMAVFDYFVTNAEEPDRAKLSLKLLAHAFENTLNMRPDIRVVQPVLELAINKNLFTEAPILTMGDEAVLPEDQDDPRISPSYRLLSRLMPEAAPEALRSPKQLQHLGRGYIGNMQDYLLLVTDMAARRIMGEPAGAERSGPFSSSFRQTGPARSTRYSNTLYEVAEEADRVASSINRLEKAGTDEADARIEKLEAENEQLLDVRDDFVDAAKDVGELRKEMREIQLDPDLTSEEKREQMDELQQEINETAEDIFDLRPGGKLNENTISELIGRSVPEQQKILRNAGLPSTAAALG